MKKPQTQKSGFITLFFILGISFTFLTWISLSSERVFEYIRIKDEFNKSRLILNNHISCADAFVDNFINSQYNLEYVNRESVFTRSLYFSDNTICQIKDINITYLNNNLSDIFFISGDFSFEYKFENGFVKYVKSFNIL